MKRFWRWSLRALLGIAALGIVLLAIAAVTLWRLDQDDYRRLAVWGAARFAGCRMVVDGPFALSLGWEPSLRAAGLRFEALPGRPPPALAAIGRLDLKLVLRPLLARTLLVRRFYLDDVRIAHVVAAAGPAQNARPPTPPAAPEPWLLVIESVRISRVMADFFDPASGRSLNVRLQEMTVDDVHDAGPLLVKAIGRVNGQPLNVEGQLGSLAELNRPEAPFPVDLRGSLAGFSAALTGRVAHLMAGEGLDLQITVPEQEISNLVDTLDLTIPLRGRLSLNASLTGDLNAPRLQDLALNLREDEAFSFSLRGSVANLLTGEGTAIDLSEECRDVRLLKLIFPADWQVVEFFGFSARWRETAEGYMLEAIQARLQNDKQITLEASGALHFGPLHAGLPPTAVDLQLRLASSDTTAIRPLLTHAIPEIGHVRAAARLVGPVARLALEDLVIERGGEGPVRVISKGRIGWIPIDEHPVSDMLFDFTITSEHSAVLADFYGVPIGEIGRVKLTGRVVGSSERFRLEDVHMETRDQRGLETLVTGGIDFAEDPQTADIRGDVHFQLAIAAPNLGATEPLLNLGLLAPLGPVKARARVAGTTEVLSFEDILVQAGAPTQSWVEWRGRIARIPLVGEDPVSGYETTGTLSAARSAELAAHFGWQLPDLGPLQLTWRDVDRNGRLGIQDIRIGLGDGRQLDLQGRGAVASIYQGDQMAVAGIDLSFRLQAPDTQFISRLLDLSLPDLGAVQGQWRLTGDQQALLLQDARLSTTHPGGLQLAAQGREARFVLQPRRALDQIDLQIEARAPDIRRTPGLTGAGVPDLGPLAARARLKSEAAGLALSPLEVEIGPQASPVLRLLGRIDRLDRPATAALAADIRWDAAPWLPPPPSPAAPGASVFSGSVRLQGAQSGRGVNLAALDLTCPAAGGLTLKSSGSLLPGEAHPEVDLQLDLSAPQPAAWGARLGFPVPPTAALKLDGRYRWQGAQHQFTGRTRLGRTTLQTTFQQSGQRARPDFYLRFTTPLLYLEDLGLTYAPQPDPKKPGPPAGKGPPKMFGDRPLDFAQLQKTDLALRLEADQVLGQDDRMERLQAGAILKNGRLNLGPITFQHAEGFASLAAEVDTHAASPAIKVRVSAEDLDVGKWLAYLHKPLFAQGKLNLLVDLRTSGQTPAALAAGLSGTLGLALEYGRIKRVFNLLASDALDFVFTAPAYDTYTDLRCMALQVNFAKGQGDLQVLYADTPAVRLKGAGQIDLAAQTLKVVLEPEAKRRLFMPASPVKISGDLADPSVFKIPTEEAALLAGDILVPYVTLPARLVGYLWSLVKNDKDGGSPCVDLELQPSAEP